MSSIQGNINSMVGSASHAIMAYKGYQELKAKKAKEVAKQSAAKQQKGGKGSGVTPLNPGEKNIRMEQANQHSQQVAQQQARQRRNFMEYLRKRDSSFDKVGSLPDNLQKAIAKQYTPSMRRKLMNDMDNSKGGKK